MTLTARGLGTWWRALSSPAVLLGAGLLLAVVTFELWPTAATPGFHHDEVSAAYNAYAISRDGHDQGGHLLPLFFSSFTDYLSPLFIYALALVFKVTGPSVTAAREFGAICVLASILALGWLARRRTGSGRIALVVVVLGALTPWLYELSRTGFEMTLEPLTIVLVLLAVDWAYRSPDRAFSRGITVAAALAALTYVYAAGRGLAPLYAGALILFAGHGRWRWLITTWIAYAVALIPLVLHHKQASHRLHDTTYIHSNLSIFTDVKDLAWNYARDVDLVYWVRSGDPKPYIHTWGAGQLLAGVVVLALAGVAIALVRLRHDRWWRWAIAVLLLSPIPAGLTGERHQAQRLLPLPVLLLVCAIPAVEQLARWDRRAWAAGLGAVLSLAVATQFGWFEHIYHQRGGTRRVFFEADVPPLLTRAFANGRTVYIDLDDHYAQTQALWFAVTHGLPRSRVSILPDGGIPPVGSMVFGRVQTCDYVCVHLATADTYWIARAIGPKPG